MQEYMIITQRGEKIFFVSRSFTSAWDQVQAYIHRNSTDAFQVFAANRGVGPKWSLILRNTDKQLEAEYDYRTGEEACREAIEANKYEFDEKGELA